MKLVKFIYNGKELWGVLAQDSITVLKEPPFKKIITGNKILPLAEVRLLAPCSASKVVLVGLNYKDHARELNMNVPENPIIFLKPATALSGPEERIIYPEGVNRLDYEAELALVIKKTACKIEEKDAGQYILGYTCLNDITARDQQEKDGQWTRAKSYDTFCPLGPWIETDLDPSPVRIKAVLNGRTVQDSNTENFIFPVNRLVSFISRIMTLMPGDVISTGTPSGIGPMNPGDTIEVEIEGIGILKNTVASPES